MLLAVMVVVDDDVVSRHHECGRRLGGRDGVVCVFGARQKTTEEALQSIFPAGRAGGRGGCV